MAWLLHYRLGIVRTESLADWLLEEKCYNLFNPVPNWNVKKNKYAKEINSKTRVWWFVAYSSWCWHGNNNAPPPPQTHKA